jgi:hypothetical protein
MDAAALSALTTLEPTESRNKGDSRPQGNLTYKFSFVQFLPNPEPDEFEDKLTRLLDFLERDVHGVKMLVDHAQTCVQVASYFHIGGGMIGGYHVSADAARRVSSLGLAIDFDIYVSGKEFE